MVKKEMIAMLLAGGQGGRLGVLTRNTAKAAIPFGGKYRVIDFPLSNCINSGIDTVGVLTRYRPLRLNEHIGIGIPWDLDRIEGGVTILPPYDKMRGNGWYAGNANAVYENMEYMESFHPDYVLIASGGDISKMDYDTMLSYHKANNADVTVAVKQHPRGGDLRFFSPERGEMNRVISWTEKEIDTESLFGIHVYIFSWPVLKDMLTQLNRVPGCSFDEHVIPLCIDKGYKVFSFEYGGYWNSVSTLAAYRDANLDLVCESPGLNLYEEYWQVYTGSERLQPAFIDTSSFVEGSIIGEGSDIAGTVSNSVLGPGVVVEEGATVTGSVIMGGCHIGAGSRVSNAIISENVSIGKNVNIGEGGYAVSRYDQRVYCCDLAVIGENSYIPDDVTIGKNTAVMGKTAAEDYADASLPGGGFLIKAGEGE